MGRAQRVDDARIIATARWLFLMHGHAVSTSEIARDVGIAESALFKRFGSREALFFAAMTPTPVPVEDVLGTRDDMYAIRDAEDARAWLHGVARALVQLCKDTLPCAWLVLGVTAPEPHVYERWWRADPCRAVQAELAVRLVMLAEAGHIMAMDSNAAAQLLVAAARDVVFANASLPPSRPSARALERRIDGMLEQLWSGIASRRRVGGWTG